MCPISKIQGNSYHVMPNFKTQTNLCGSSVRSQGVKENVIALLQSLSIAYLHSLKLVKNNPILFWCL